MVSEKNRLSVVTPSYSADSELCRDLNRSILRWMPESVQHHIVVPKQDLPIFRMLAGDRTIVHEVAEFLPTNFRKAPMLNAWINSHHPWPPVRGWITQQLIKLAAVATLDVEAVLLADSDLVFVGPTDLASFQQNGNLALYRKPDAVHAGLPRHQMWLESAHNLLGLTLHNSENHTDYICWPCAWDTGIVRSMLQRVEEFSGMSWQSAIASQLHFSEMMLYGTYVDEILGGSAAVTSSMRSIIYSDEAPLTLAEISSLLHTGQPDVQSVMISAKSGIPHHVRSQALRDYTAFLSHSRAGAS